MQVTIHREQDYIAMRKAGQLAAKTLRYLASYVQPGITTKQLDNLAYQFILAQGAWPAPLNYCGFPNSICTSINEVVCHGIPSDRVLAAGDIINIDVTVILEGWHGDTSQTFKVGKVSDKAKKIIAVAKETMVRGIAQVKPGNQLGDVGYAMQTYATAQGCEVVRDYCGHGLGKKFHEEPQVLNYGKQQEGLVLRPGMFFTVEPMVNLGGAKVRILKDGWTVITADYSLSAQFEHSLGVTADGSELFTT